ncbi:MAG: type I DNA topoisomerase [Ginsengibacter sp.]
MAKNLLIVESPAKARTIEKILGEDFEVKSCYGHIRDLEKDDMGIDIKNHFSPRYKVHEDKEKVVKELKQLAKKAGEVWLASDEDREGESISWHLAEVLGLDPKTTKRIVFHEITKNAIQKAVQTPRTINMDLVNAQQARRILDRIVGFELSPVLWRKIGMQRSLSAGRVQSVAVRLIVEKEREINQFKSTSSFKVEGLFSAEQNNQPITFKAEDGRKHEVEAAEKFLESCKGAAYTVVDIQVKPGKRSPAAPFTTSTLQQEASRKLGYGVSKTMLLAQRLYESGKITYMRTDSVNLSDTALDEMKEEINSSYGEKYLHVRKYKTKNESAQEAHEAIRPSYIKNSTDDDPDSRRLYELIWKRTIASQMSDAELEKTTAKISISTNKDELTASGEVLKFDGFLKVYMESSDEDEEQNGAAPVDSQNESRLPKLNVGQKLKLEQLTATERFTKPSARYTEASLVKKLEELGIGRPSTYAPTISTIIKRNYVEKRDKEGYKRAFRIVRLKNDQVEKLEQEENTGVEKSKLFPTDLGLVVTDFLKQHFDEVMDYSFTANIEEEFDKIAEGKQLWSKMVGDFYEPFHKDVEHTLENADRAKGERILGTDETSGKPISARMGRFGPMVQIGSQEDEEKPRFAKLKPTQSIETITIEEALDLFKLPRSLGAFEDVDVSVNIGRFGPYAAHDGKFYSLNKEMDPYTVEIDEISPMIADKRQAKSERTIKVFEKEKIQILKGPYGPYIKQGLRNYKLNKEQQEKAADLSIDEVKQIIEYLKANPPKKTAAKRKKK